MKQMEDVSKVIVEALAKAGADPHVSLLGCLKAAASIAVTQPQMTKTTFQQDAKKAFKRATAARKKMLEQN